MRLSPLLRPHEPWCASLTASHRSQRFKFSFFSYFLGYLQAVWIDKVQARLPGHRACSGWRRNCNYSLRLQVGTHDMIDRYDMAWNLYMEQERAHRKDIMTSNSQRRGESSALRVHGLIGNFQVRFNNVSVSKADWCDSFHFFLFVQLWFTQCIYRCSVAMAPSCSRKPQKNYELNWISKPTTKPNQPLVFSPEEWRSLLTGC